MEDCYAKFIFNADGTGIIEGKTPGEETQKLDFFWTRNGNKIYGTEKREVGERSHDDVEPLWIVSLNKNTLVLGESYDDGKNFRDLMYFKRIDNGQQWIDKAKNALGNIFGSNK